MSRRFSTSLLESVIVTTSEYDAATVDDTVSGNAFGAPTALAALTSVICVTSTVV